MNESSPTPSRLARTLNVRDAVILGLGSMIGAGIFVAAAPAAAAAGSGVLLGVLIAGVMALLNATSVAQLAAHYPESGGAYVYGRKRLGKIWGFLAGWGFVIGKLASCAAMALTFGFYAAPEYARWLAVGATLTLTAVNYFGVKKTAFATKVIVTFVMISLLIVALAALGGGGADSSRLTGWLNQGGFSGIFQSAGIMFFAFAGYARIATLGEEVISPQKTIPKAILIALGITIMIYIILIAIIILCVDIEVLSQSTAPLVVAVKSGKYGSIAPLVRVGASFASLGVLLSLLAGVSRTMFAMAASGDIPRWLSAVHDKYKVPHRAEVTAGAVITMVVAVADLRLAIGFSSFAVLIYYTIANISAWTLPAEKRRFPRWMSLVGAATCLTVAVCLPAASVLAGLGLFGLGLIVYQMKRRGGADSSLHLCL